MLSKSLSFFINFFCAIKSMRKQNILLKKKRMFSQWAYQYCYHFFTIQIIATDIHKVCTTQKFINLSVHESFLLLLGFTVFVIFTFSPSSICRSFDSHQNMTALVHIFYVNSFSIALSGQGPQLWYVEETQCFFNSIYSSSQF